MKKDCSRHQIKVSTGMVFISWFSIWGMAYAAGIEIGDNIAEMVKFFGWLITVILSGTAGLIIFIYRATIRSVAVERDLNIKNLRTEVMGDLDNMGTKLNGHGDRLMRLEGGVASVQEILRKEYVRTEECKREHSKT